MFLWLSSTDIAIERVKIRVREGGHNIPVNTVTRRYENGLKNLFKYYLAIVDRWIIVDNSGKTFKFIAEGSRGKNIIENKVVWNELKKEYND
jgi:predicted ABC-type ATPase